MEFRTLVSIPPQPDICFGYTDGLLLLGSCFAEEVGKKLSENKFKVDINPFGTLYNP
ncbi:MAG: GSCFA domain-containing protein, partial [Tannerellaceae bacterium]|nr:GSCFA domain-containing protein [Tannerellaceae bacterium]